MKPDDLKAQLRERAEELPAEIAERENEADSHCGAYGTSTAEDYLDDPDRLLLIEAATAITDLEALRDELGEALESAPLIGMTESHSVFRSRQDEWLLKWLRPTLAKLEKARG